MILEEHRDGDVLVVVWNDGENRYHGDSVQAWHDLLDRVEADADPYAMVVVGTGKFFSNGLDLDWMQANPEAAGPMVEDVHRLFGRLLTLNRYTVGAINGHAFAGGAMLTCCFDERVMRSDRGYWCLPEVDLGLPLTPAMYATVAARLPQGALHESIVTGRRYAASEAVVAGIVEHAAGEERVLVVATERAAAMAHKNRSVIGNHKRQMYGGVAAICGAS